MDNQLSLDQMNVNLTPELEELVRQRVSSGRYRSASEVVRHGLRLLEEDERWRAEVRAKIAEGMADARAGRLRDGEEVFAELVRELDETDESNG